MIKLRLFVFYLYDEITLETNLKLWIFCLNWQIGVILNYSILTDFTHINELEK